MINARFQVQIAHGADRVRAARPLGKMMFLTGLLAFALQQNW
jgi:hypothetical protein